MLLPTAPTIYRVEPSCRRADPAQQPARHLHQLRQPARPCALAAAGRVPAGRPADGRHAGGARLAGPAAGGARPRLAARERAAARRTAATLPVQPSLAGGCGGSDRDCGGRRPYVRRCRSTVSWRSSAQLGAGQPGPAELSPLRASRHDAAQARPGAGANGGRRRSRSRSGGSAAAAFGPPSRRASRRRSGSGRSSLRTAARSRGFCAKATR